MEGTGTVFFEIPDDVEIMAKLVEAVPSGWSCMDGTLQYPKDVVDASKVAIGSGFELGRFYNINPTVIGLRRGEVPDLFGIMVEQKWPDFVSFTEAGFERRDLTLEIAKRVAVGFIRKGYRGRLYFNIRVRDDETYNTLAECYIAPYPWKTSSLKIKLEWFEKYGGTRKMVSPIETVCKDLKLREYT